MVRKALPRYLVGWLQYTHMVAYTKWIQLPELPRCPREGIPTSATSIFARVSSLLACLTKCRHASSSCTSQLLKNQSTTLSILTHTYIIQPRDSVSLENSDPDPDSHRDTESFLTVTSNQYSHTQRQSCSNYFRLSFLSYKGNHTDRRNQTICTLLCQAFTGHKVCMTHHGIGSIRSLLLFIARWYSTVCIKHTCVFSLQWMDIEAVSS